MYFTSQSDRSHIPAVRSDRSILPINTAFIRLRVRPLQRARGRRGEKNSEQSYTCVSHLHALPQLRAILHGRLLSLEENHKSQLKYHFLVRSSCGSDLEFDVHLSDRAIRLEEIAGVALPVFTSAFHLPQHQDQSLRNAGHRDSHALQAKEVRYRMIFPMLGSRSQINHRHKSLVYHGTLRNSILRTTPLDHPDLAGHLHNSPPLPDEPADRESLHHGINRNDAGDLPSLGIEGE